MSSRAGLCGRDLLAIDDLTSAELAYVLDRAAEAKSAWRLGERSAPLAGRAVAIVLQKPSLRTRISFEVACARLGAHPVVMTGPDGAFSRGESIADTARVMERYVDAIVLRTYEQSVLEGFASSASVPVVNALSDEHHPCQGLADLLTIKERFGTLSGLAFTFVGDGSNNMAHTYLLGGALCGMHVSVATPIGYQPDAKVLARARGLADASGGSVSVCTDAARAVSGASVVATDTWASMGQEGEHDDRADAFACYQVNEALMAYADSSAIFLHCLPAHRGEEVTDFVIDGRQSVVFDEAENRLHAQQALLELIIV
ncbi:MAG: ornithine carbamoyltransferase [Coriobacteriia bacterium]|nr:ornithine carbamoyltransferase [Coriobacteriia bacterium]